MRYEGLDLVITSEELVAASMLAGAPFGSLSRLPRVSPAEDVEAQVQEFLETLSTERLAATEAMVTAVANPGRAAALHYALGDLELRRCILVWHPAIGPAWTLMYFSGSCWCLRLITPEELLRVMMEVLQESVPLRASPYRCCLDVTSAQLFLGILHLLHVAHLQACLTHCESPLAFEAGMLPDVLRETRTEDFRWPLYFFDKVLPVSMSAAIWEEELAPALADLVAHGLVVATGDDYALTPEGFIFAAGFRSQLTKVALRFTSQADSDVEAHEAFLLVRSLHDLHLVDIGGKEGALASISFPEARLLLSELLRIGTPAATATCPHCAATIGPGARFCGSCGKALPG